MNAMKRRHARLKLVRGRGWSSQSHLAASRYLRSLEAERFALTSVFPREMRRVTGLLAKAWRAIDAPDQFPNVVVAMDQAQQRMHHLIRRVAS